VNISEGSIIKNLPYLNWFCQHSLWNTRRIYIAW